MENDKQNAIVKKEPGAIIRHPEPERMLVAPFADLFETAEDFILKLDMPGAKKDSIRLTVESELLTIQAANNSFTDKYGKLLYCEIGNKNYIREFRVGRGIDLDAISAQLADGVLTIILPKTDEVKAREININ